MSVAQDTALSIFMKHIGMVKVNGTIFRKTVLDELKETLGCSQSSAAVRYNEAKKFVEATDPEAVANLGRGKSQAFNPHLPYQPAPPPTKTIFALNKDSIRPTSVWDADLLTQLPTERSYLVGVVVDATEEPPKDVVKHLALSDFSDEPPYPDFIDYDDIWSVFALDTESRSAPVMHERQYEYQGEASEEFDEKVETFPNKHWVMVKGAAPMSFNSFNEKMRKNIIKEHVPEESQLPVVAADSTYHFFVDDELFTVKAKDSVAALRALRVQYPKAEIEEATAEELAELE